MAPSCFSSSPPPPPQFINMTEETDPQELAASRDVDRGIELIREHAKEDPFFVQAQLQAQAATPGKGQAIAIILLKKLQQEGILQ